MGIYTPYTANKAKHSQLTTQFLPRQSRRCWDAVLAEQGKSIAFSSAFQMEVECSMDFHGVLKTSRDTPVIGEQG